MVDRNQHFNKSKGRRVLGNWTLILRAFDNFLYYIPRCIDWKIFSLPTHYVTKEELCCLFSKSTMYLLGCLICQKQAMRPPRDLPQKIEVAQQENFRF